MADNTIPDWKLERFLLGELSSEEMRAIESRMASDPDLRRRLEILEASNAEILNEHPPREMTKAILNRARPAGSTPARTRTTYRRALVSAMALGTAAFRFLLVKPAGFDREGGVPVSEVPDIIRLKGMEPGLFVFKKTAGEPLLLLDGAGTRAGDVLQLAYVSTERPYGIILSIDGRGVVTLHHPPNEAASQKLELNRRVFLENAYQLDDAPLFERFFFVSSASPLDVRAVRAAAERLAADPARAERDGLALDPKALQISFTVKKESGR